MCQSCLSISVSVIVLLCVRLCLRGIEGNWLSDCLSVNTDTSRLLEGKHLDISAWPYTCPARDDLFSLSGRSADICTCMSVYVYVCISQTKQDNVWPVGLWFWNLFHPQVTVKLLEQQVCSSSRCISPCLYLQLFSPLSADILLTRLCTESHNSSDLLWYFKQQD